jgi:hypothetical protein
LLLGTGFVLLLILLLGQPTDTSAKAEATAKTKEEDPNVKVAKQAEPKVKEEPRTNREDTKALAEQREKEISDKEIAAQRAKLDQEEKERQEKVRREREQKEAAQQAEAGAIRNGRQEREKLLAAWEARKSATLADLEAEFQKLLTEAQSLEREGRAWEGVDLADLAFNQKALNEYNAYRRAVAANYSKTQELREKMRQKNNDFVQEKRRILVKFPDKDDPKFIEDKGLLLTPEEKASVEAVAQAHSTPRTAADDIIQRLEQKKMIPSATYTGLATNPADSRTAAVCYNLNGPLGTKYVTNQPVYVMVYKGVDGYWYVTDTSGTGGDVHLGPPPSGYSGPMGVGLPRPKK